MPPGGRVAPGPACTRGPAITFRFNGRPVNAFEGETLGAALHADGERALMRSIKYHRPRGLFCNTGKCANCLVRVDGTPNVRACVTPVRDGQVVETQNAFPSARRDLFSIVDKVYAENFDYHRRFIRPRIFTPIYHRVIRAMAGFGKVPDLRPLPARRPTIGRLDIGVAVVGAGPSGLAAAVAAAEGAASVAVFDEADRAGGSLLLEGRTPAANALVARLTDARAHLHTRAVAFGAYQTDGHGEILRPPGILAVMTANRILEVHARSLVVAPGYHETPPLFAGNDLPGVMGARAALILLHRHGILPGTRIALTGRGETLDIVERDLKAAGAQIVGRTGTAEWKNTHIIEAFGSDRVEGIILERDGATWKESADCVLASGDETPRVELLQQCGARLTWRDALVPEQNGGVTSVPGVFTTGSVTGPLTLDQRLTAGTKTGEAAARWARGGPT